MPRARSRSQVLVVVRHLREQLVGDLRDQLRLPGPHHRRDADRIFPLRGPPLLQLAGDGLLVGVRVDHRQPPHRAVRLREVHDGPGPQVGEGEPGHPLQDRLEVERFGEVPAGIGQEGPARPRVGRGVTRRRDRSPSLRLAFVPALGGLVLRRP
jgi:hypothetical protein